MDNRETRDRVGKFMLAHGLHMGDKVDAGKVQDMLAEYAVALEDANSLCRSAHLIAERKGLQTNWDEFLLQLDKSLELQHQMIFGGERNRMNPTIADLLEELLSLGSWNLKTHKRAIVIKSEILRIDVAQSEEIRRLRSGSNYVANNEVFPSEVTFANGRVVRIAYDGAEQKHFLVIDKNI